MRGTALVLGGAKCVWADIAKAVKVTRFQGVLACNHIGIVFPRRLDAWCSLHPDQFGAWCALREARGLSRHKRLYGQTGAAYVTQAVPVTLTPMDFPGQAMNGTSSLFACKVALIDLGFDRVVLCGAPMEDGPHFYGDHGLPHASQHRAGWLEALPHIRDRVRSMGGWTRDLLGAPTPDWAAGSHDGIPASAG